MSMSKEEILKELRKPNLTKERESELTEMLYDDIEFKEYAKKVVDVLHKQRNGEELTDEELDILFEQMDSETARMINNQHTPTEDTN